VASATIPTITAVATISATAVITVVTLGADEAALDIYVLCNVGKQGKLTRTLDSVCDLALVTAARTCDAATTELASVRNKATECCYVTPIDVFNLVFAVRAGLATAGAHSLVSPT